MLCRNEIKHNKQKKKGLVLCVVTSEVGKLFGEVQSLKSQIPSRRQNESPNALHRHVLIQALKHGDKKRRRFARASASHGHHIGAGENDGHRLSLDWGRHLVPFPLYSSQHVRV